MNGFKTKILLIGGALAFVVYLQMCVDFKTLMSPEGSEESVSDSQEIIAPIQGGEVLPEPATGETADSETPGETPLPDDGEMPNDGVTP